MKRELVLTGYKIERCGFYKNFMKTPYVFGSLQETLKHLIKWADGKSLISTKTSEPEGHLPTYLLDICTNKDEYLICTWNELPTFSGNVLSVSGTDKVGTSAFEEAKVAEGNIPGHPTYFWFRPAKGMYYAVQLPGTLNGRIHLNEYIENFLGRYDPNYVIREEKETIDDGLQMVVTGYKDPITSKKYDNAEIDAYFQTSLMRLKGTSVSIIESQLNQVYKLIKKDTLSAKIQDDKSMFEKARIFFGMTSDVPLSNTAHQRIRYELNYSPSLDEFKEIVKKWENSEDSKWDDVGFLMHKKQSPIWLSSIIPREKIDLEVIYVNDHAVDCLQLLKALQKSSIK